MHLHSHSMVSSAASASGSSGIATNSMRSALSVASSRESSGWINIPSIGSNLIEKWKSIFSSPISMAILQATKQSFLNKRAYVDNRSADIVDLCICLASTIGTMTIIIPYCINHRSRKLRHSLILGLATSDLVSSLLIIATTSYSIAGHDLATASSFCTFAGFIFSSSIWTQHQWNLSIATITYMILVHPLSSFVSNVERHMVWLWPVFWAIAFIANGIAWRYVGFSDVDGYCTYNANKGGEYFSGIFTFVPRAIVSIVILVLYTHLFIFLRRTNLFSAVTSSNGSPRRSVTSSGAYRQEQTNRSKDNNGTLSIATDSRYKRGSIGRTTSSVLTHIKRNYSLTSPTPTQASSTAVGDNGSSKRNGSSSTQGKSSVTPLFPPTGKGNDQDAELSPKTKILNGEEVDFARQQQQYLSQSCDDRLRVKLNKLDLQRPSTASLSPRPSDPLTISRRPMTAPSSGNESGSDVDLESLNDSAYSRKNELGIHDALAHLTGEDDLFKPMGIRSDNRDFGMTSPPQEHLRHFSLSPVGVKFAKKALAERANERSSMMADELAVLPTAQMNAESGQSSESSEKGESSGNKGASTDVQGPVTYEDLLKPGWQWGMAVQQSGPRGTGQPTTVTSEGNADQQNRRRSSRWQSWQPWQAKNERGQGTNSFGSSTEENGVEALGSTLNRQASVLMLLYPAAYVLLFSISIVRILVDISNTAAGSKNPRRNSDALHSIARWSVFAQGAIDAIVFMLIERQFRLRMRRKRRIAAGEKVEDIWLIRILKSAKSKKCSKKAKQEREREEREKKENDADKK